MCISNSHGPFVLFHLHLPPREWISSSPVSLESIAPAARDSHEQRPARRRGHATPPPGRRGSAADGDVDSTGPFLDRLGPPPPPPVSPSTSASTLEIVHQIRPTSARRTSRTNGRPPHPVGPGGARPSSRSPRRTTSGCRASTPSCVVIGEVSRGKSDAESAARSSSKRAKCAHHPSDEVESAVSSGTRLDLHH